METALNLRCRRESGIPSVAVKCVEIRRNTSGEERLFGCNQLRRRGANGIRLPGSPAVNDDAVLVS